MGSDDFEYVDIDYEGVLRTLTAWSGEGVSVSVEDGETVMGTVAAISGTLGGPYEQETPAGVEGVVFTVGAIDEGHPIPSSHFAVWRTAFRAGKTTRGRVEFRIGSLVIVVDRHRW
jgi:hypothetical protein